LRDLAQIYSQLNKLQSLMPHKKLSRHSPLFYKFIELLHHLLSCR
jgi:hypothetical protein